MTGLKCDHSSLIINKPTVRSISGNDNVGTPTQLTHILTFTLTVAVVSEHEKRKSDQQKNRERARWALGDGRTDFKSKPAACLLVDQIVIEANRDGRLS